MNDYKIKISKGDFKKVLARHEPSKFIKVAFLLFSLSSRSKVRYIISGALVVVFIIGFIGAIIGKGILAAVMGFIILISLIIIGAVILLAGYLNNRRIKAILKDLSITYGEYLQLIGLMGTDGEVHFKDSLV